MALLDHNTKSIVAKLVYWGPAGSGKWTNLEYIHAKTAPADRPRGEKANSIGLPLKMPDIRGWSTTFNLLRVPSDGAWTRYVFDEIPGNGCDGVVFVADASPHAGAANVASLELLSAELAARGFDLAKLPLVFQYNKLDVAGAATGQQLAAQLNPRRVPEVEAIATQGIGVFDALKAAARSIDRKSVV